MGKILNKERPQEGLCQGVSMKKPDRFPCPAL